MTQLIYNYSDVKRQVLDIHSCWRITYHGLFDIEANPYIKLIGNPYPELSHWDLYFTQDLLQLENHRYLIDVGWSREGEPWGNYKVTVLDGVGGEMDWSSPVIVLCTRSKSDLLKCLKILSFVYADEQNQS